MSSLNLRCTVHLSSKGSKGSALQQHTACCQNTKRPSGAPYGRQLARQHVPGWCITAAPTWNPQNVPDPKVMPRPDFSAEQTVRIQLDALQNNDQPWPNHGIQTAYEFGEDIGGMERSRYFGYSKDLYHYDHFMGQFSNDLGILVNLENYGVVRCGAEEGGRCMVDVDVTGANGQQEQLRILLKRKDVGRKKGSLMTLAETRAIPEFHFELIIGGMDIARSLPLRSLNHISRVVANLEASVRFYEGVLGFQLIKRPRFDFEGQWMFHYDLGVGVHLLQGTAKLDPPATINPKADHLSFTADNLQVVEERLQELGVNYICDSVEEGGVRVRQVFLTDPDGNLIEICNCDALPVEPLRWCALPNLKSMLPQQLATSQITRVV